MRRGNQKYSNAEICKAIVQFENGVSLDELHKTTGVAKNTIKYWLDNAHKFLARMNVDPDEAASKTLERLQKKMESQRWDIVALTMKHIHKKIPDADIPTLLRVLNDFSPRLNPRMQTKGEVLGDLGKDKDKPLKVGEQETSIVMRVRQLLDKKAGSPGPGKDVIDSSAVIETVADPAEPSAPESDHVIEPVPDVGAPAVDDSAAPSAPSSTTMASRSEGESK